jgi:hypothetical protein
LEFRLGLYDFHQSIVSLSFKQNPTRLIIALSPSFYCFISVTSNEKLPFIEPAKEDNESEKTRKQRGVLDLEKSNDLKNCLIEFINVSKLHPCEYRYPTMLKNNGKPSLLSSYQKLLVD